MSQQQNSSDFALDEDKRGPNLIRQSHAASLVLFATHIRSKVSKISLRSTIQTNTTKELPT